MTTLADLKDDLDLVLKHTEPLWLKLKDKTIFVTGGTGFFGIWFQMSFVHANKKFNLGAKMIVLTRNKDRFINKCPG